MCLRVRECVCGKGRKDLIEECGLEVFLRLGDRISINFKETPSSSRFS